MSRSPGAGGVRHAAPIAVLRDGTPVGAWLFKANPAVWDVLGAIERGEGLDRWRLAWSYRVELVDAGHPCVLWVTGGGSSRHPAGIWAVGETVARPEVLADDPDDPGWGDAAGPPDVRPYVAVDLRVLPTVISRRQLVADPRFASLEVIRVPRLASPLALTPGEWSGLRSIVED